jgi:adenylate cyclase class 2
MGYEVEIKFRVPDHNEVRKRLAPIGAMPGPEFEVVDLYLAHPARDFAKTDEALRIRRQGDSNRVTYKGPKQAGPTKTREEIEVPFAAGTQALEQMAQVFDRIGFRTVARVEKTRSSAGVVYQGRPIGLALDFAEGLGSFVEVEATACGALDLADAQKAVMGLAQELGLVEVEPRSYLQMSLERLAGTLNPSGST